MKQVKIGVIGVTGRGVLWKHWHKTLMLDVSVTPSHVLEPVKEAFEKYLGYEVSVV